MTKCLVYKESNVKPVEYKGSFINGEFNKPQRAEESWVVKSPADLNDEVIQIEASYQDVDKACEAAKEAFVAWSQLSFDERINYLRKLATVFETHKEDLAELISRETGKPLWETRTEAGALSAKVKVTIEDSFKLVEDVRIENALPNVDGYIRYRPKGPMVVLGPFNFPAHLPNGHFIPALLMGNTVVFKPSDKTPAVGQFMAEMFSRAELPRGVFNMVQGQAEIGKRLAKHNDINAVLFTGSYEVGLKIKRDTVDHYWKSLALEMGGKNAAIVWDDAEIEKTVYENVVGSFLSAGQRCSCTSRMYVHENIYDEYVEKFKKLTMGLSVGHWSENNFMGSLIDEDAYLRFFRYQDIARREGAEPILLGEKVETKYEGYYTSPAIFSVDQPSVDSVYQKSEIFGPNVAIYKVNDLEQAISMVNDSSYGLSSAIFTKNKANYEKALSTLDVGLLNWNRTTNGSSSRLPFGGTKKSGNGHPSAHFAVYYCSTPIASLEDETVFDKSKVMPGIDFNI